MIAIIKYNAGNISSVQNALTRLGYKSIVTDKADEILNADKVILPGVGEASTAMKYLKEKGLDQVIMKVKQPLLGICLGLQLMCNHTEEGDTKCLSIFNAQVKKFSAKKIVPHMGWNNFSTTEGKLLEGVTKVDNTYYVHSYYAEISEETEASCHYIQPFSAVMHKNNFYATQFHPEKSADVGEQLLKNFLAL